MTGQEWGRADEDGTVWVRTADGERKVGQYPGVSQDEALAYFVRKYEDLAAQVSLLEQRVKAGQVSPATPRPRSSGSSRPSRTPTPSATWTAC